MTSKNRALKNIGLAQMGVFFSANVEHNVLLTPITSLSHIQNACSSNLSRSIAKLIVVQTIADGRMQYYVGVLLSSVPLSYYYM